jgi:hypothetical protein
MEIKRVCNPGWKNCKMPELRAQIAELEEQLRRSYAITDGIRTDRRTLKAQLEAVKGITDLIMAGLARGQHYGPHRREIYELLITAIGEKEQFRLTVNGICSCGGKLVTSEWETKTYRKGRTTCSACGRTELKLEKKYD